MNGGATLGPLIPADETFHHQITDTFATVAQTDRSWTEKVCAMACARDGSLQLGFGLGKYTNRGVMDAYAGISRGVEQWTVRASRELGADPTTETVGPIKYEVLEPLRVVRFALGAERRPADHVRVGVRGSVPAALEQREHHRSRDGFRLDADIVRYHHTGTATRLGRDRRHPHRVRRDHWVSTRDHSWGVRYKVGEEPTDIARRETPPGVAILVLWCPILCERPDGSRYALHVYYQRHSFGDWQNLELQGGVEHPDGRREPFAALVPDLAFQDDNRRFLGGTLNTTMSDGTARPITLTPVSDTGFHLGTGLYHGFDGQWHGQWRGPLHTDGEYIADCSEPETARRVHQHRDCVVHVDDPVGGGAGWGNLQSLAIGPFPEMQLTEAASFI